MTILNRSALSYARSLLSAGSVDKTTSWSFSAEDGNKLLGPKGSDWKSYEKCFLGTDPKAPANTREHWKYPFAKGGKLYRSGLIAIRQRASQQSDSAIYDAAGTLLNVVDKGKSAWPEEHKDISFELKDAGNDDGTFTGYGAVFGNVDSGGDLIRQGAFADSLNSWRAKGKMPKMLWQHDTRQPIGVWQAMSEDGHGLLVQGKLTKGVQASDEAYALLKDGALDGLSIGYQTVESEYDSDLNVRSLNKLDLMEVSVVTIPMNQAAAVTSVKSLIDTIETLSDAERVLREAGRDFSKKEATDFVSVVNKIARREAGDDQSANEYIAALNRLAQKLRG